jgi:hypothetical protein
MKKIKLIDVILNWNKFSEWLIAIIAIYNEREKTTNSTDAVRGAGEEPKPLPPIVLPPFPFNIK